MIRFSVLRSAHLVDAVSMSTAEGWNQTFADWSRIVRLSPAGCFAAYHDERLIGTVSTTPYGRDLAWIGMMIVHPHFRGVGVGAALMRHALDEAGARGIACIKLDATPAGHPLYESLGFVSESEIQRWQGVPSATLFGEDTHSPDTDTPTNVPESDQSRAAIYALDHAAHGAHRMQLLDELLTDYSHGPVIMRSPNNDVEGFVLARPGRAATYVGPMIATRERVVEPLLDRMFTRLAGQQVCIDLHADRWLRGDMLEARGLRRTRDLSRMRLGARCDAAIPHALCASAGPEFG